MANYEEFLETKKLMQRLWPKWKAEEEVGKLLNERWAHLHQDKLRECIRNHRFLREVRPDITAIHKAYCDVTQGTTLAAEGVNAAERTRRELQVSHGPSRRELDDWSAWAEDILATASEQEIAHAKSQTGVAGANRRILAVAVDHCRRNRTCAG